MRSFSGIPALPADICQQLHAMPLSEKERRDVASALISFFSSGSPVPGAHFVAHKNAPQPDWQQGV